MRAMQEADTVVTNAETDLKTVERAIGAWAEKAKKTRDALPLMQQIGKRFDEECAEERNAALEALRGFKLNGKAFDVDGFIESYNAEGIKSIGRVYKNDVEASAALDRQFRGFVASAKSNVKG